ncbi:MAG: hypothetical protein J5772_04515 [Clostridia bacterium]|nr:hypothetical protein [Clostridia bacterium]
MEEIYLNAIRLMQGALYDDAAEEFGRIPDYKDSAERKLECERMSDGARKDRIYAEAQKAALSPIVRGQKKAISLFKTIPGWRDSDEQAEAALRRIDDIRAKDEADRREAKRIQTEKQAKMKKLRKRLTIAATALVLTLGAAFGAYRYYKTILRPKLDYKKAVSLMETGELDEAYLLLKKVDSAENDEKLLEIMKTRLSVAQVGSSVLFGTCEQDANKSNGSEAIEWLVVDKKDDKLLLVSKYAIDALPFNGVLGDKPFTWSNCTLREWLNQTYIDLLFTSGERSLICTTRVSAEPNPFYPDIDPGSPTTDKMFILSISEVLKYFPTDADRLCSSTPEAARLGAYGGLHDYCLWWLRNPGSDDYPSRTVVISSDGTIKYIGHFVDNQNYAVRPAIWVSAEGMTRQ